MQALCIWGKALGFEATAVLETLGVQVVTLTDISQLTVPCWAKNPLLG